MKKPKDAARIFDAKVKEERKKCSKQIGFTAFFPILMITLTREAMGE